MFTIPFAGLICLLLARGITLRYAVRDSQYSVSLFQKGLQWIKCIRILGPCKKRIKLVRFSFDSLRSNVFFLFSLEVKSSENISG